MPHISDNFLESDASAVTTGQLSLHVGRTGGDLPAVTFHQPVSIARSHTSPDLYRPDGSTGYYSAEDEDEDDDGLTTTTNRATSIPASDREGSPAYFPERPHSVPFSNFTASRPTSGATSTMKHPSEATEAVEFNLGRAVELCCREAGDRKIGCSTCESCVLSRMLIDVASWFDRAGDSTRRRFLLGMVRRVRSPDMLQRLLTLMNGPLLAGRDRAYARARPLPALPTDYASTSADRALDPYDLEERICSTWKWFSRASYWSRSAFMLGCLQRCEAHLLHMVGVQAKTLFTSERNAFIPTDNYESSSISSSEYTFNSDHHPERDLLHTDRTYTPITRNPFNPEKEMKRVVSRNQTAAQLQPSSKITWDEVEADIINDDSGNESLTEFDQMAAALDPSCFVVPHSAKAHSGVSKYKDFIRNLPIHLAKMILGMLDQGMLNICSKVSRRWAVVVSEVLGEYFVNQELREEVMLMQGAAAHGCNPYYAKDIDVIVPNISPNSYEAIKTGSDMIEAGYKSEHSLETAYAGYQTRKIIMEERNVYCGPYNVMVLPTGDDKGYVIHTDDKYADLNVDSSSKIYSTAKLTSKTKKSRLIAMGCSDKKVRFINSDNAKFEGPTIWGHAGSIRCVAMNSPKGYVVSGSYDTSIRQWSIATRKCLRILHGHRDTITCLQIYKDWLVSGSKDKTCKVWDLLTGKCIRTFKHKYPVSAVTIDDDLCISGDEGTPNRGDTKTDEDEKNKKGGEVRVWSMKNGDFIKSLIGHEGPITAVKFDRWHIVTGSKDKYALTWSTQGDHKKCISALRHPKELLCLAFLYLRVITGSADGKLRIWNVLTGQCLRIMRGNSRSDPILNLVAIDNRITFNTHNMLLVLNFEQLEYDYTLEDDKMPSLVKYSKYSDAKIRAHPYPYIRAQRMKTAGATNPKIVQRNAGVAPLSAKTSQLCHSAKTLSERSIESAKRVQSAVTSRCPSTPIYDAIGTPETSQSRPRKTPPTPGTVVKSLYGVYPRAASSKFTANSLGLPTSGKSGTMSMVGFKQIAPIDEESVYSDDDMDGAKRRVSWAFENPLLPSGTKVIGLTDTKALLRSQMRDKNKPIPPDFIYLSVNNIQTNMKPTQASRHMEEMHRNIELERMRSSGRPSSSPSRIDPRTKIPKEQVGVDGILIEHGIEPTEIRSEAGSHFALGSGSKSLQQEVHTPSGNARTYTNPPTSAYGQIQATSDKYVTEFHLRQISTINNPYSIHPHAVPSTIPPAQILRPHTATLEQSKPLDGKNTVSDVKPSRPKSAAHTTHSSLVGGPNRHRKQPLSTEATSTSDKPIPMKMYSREVLEKIEKLKNRTREKAAMMGVGQKADDSGHGNVSPFNMPFRTHVNFELKTHEQVKQEMLRIEAVHENQRKSKQKRQDNRQRRAWLANAKGQKVGNLN